MDYVSLLSLLLLLIGAGGGYYYSCALTARQLYRFTLTCFAILVVAVGAILSSITLISANSSAAAFSFCLCFGVGILLGCLPRLLELVFSPRNKKGKRK